MEQKEYKFEVENQQIVLRGKDMEKYQPKVSIVIPIYNAEKYLHQTISSCTDQTLKDIEIICVNDCSTDKSKQIIEEFAKGDPRVRLVDHEKNLGVGLARKSGIVLTTGTYIMFLDADDYLAYDACKIAYQSILKQETDILQFGTEVFATAKVSKDELGGVRNLLRPHDGVLRCEKQGELNKLCFEKELFGYTLWNKIYAGEIVRKVVNYYAEERFNLAEDLYMFYLIAMFSRSYSSIADELYCYRFGAGITGGKRITNRTIENWIKEGLIHKYLQEFSASFDPNEITEPALKKLKSQITETVVYGWQQVGAEVDWRTQLPMMFECFDRETALSCVLHVYRQRGYVQKAEMIEALKDSEIFESDEREVRTVATFYHRMSNGGVERVISKLLPMWIAQGKRVILFTDEIESASDYEYPASVVRITLPTTQGRTEKEYKKRIQFLQRMLCQYEVDAMVYHAWTGDNLESDMLATKSLRIPFIVYTHGFFAFDLKAKEAFAACRNVFLQKLYTLADAVVTLSETDYSWWSTFHERVYKTLNPLTFELPEVKLRKEQTTNDILWIGRLSDGKQPVEALKIVEQIVNHWEKDVTLHFVGKAETKEYEKELKQKAEEMQIDSHIKWHGYHTDVIDYYQNSDLLLFTSEFEGFGLTLVEAMACGLPVVMYDIPNIDLIKNNPGAAVVKQNDVDGAAKAVVEILSDREKQRAMGQAARCSIEVTYSLDISALWARIFEDVGKKREVVKVFNKDALVNAIRMMNDFTAQGIELREMQHYGNSVSNQYALIDRGAYKDTLLQMYRDGEVGFRYIIKYAVAWLKYKLGFRK